MRVPGRRLLTYGLAVACAMLAAPAAGSAAAPLPVGKADGVRIERDRHGAMLVVFAKRAAPLYRQIAGRTVSVACWELTADGSNGGPVTFRAPKRRQPLRTGDLVRRWDFCNVWLAARKVTRGDSTIHHSRRLIVSIPLTQKGAIHIDEEAKAFVLMFSLWGAETRQGAYLSPERMIDRVGGRVPRSPQWGGPFTLVALAAPTDTPPPGAIGYYSDGGEHAAAVVVSASGRRLFLEYAPDDVLHTNIARYYGGNFFR